MDGASRFSTGRSTERGRRDGRCNLRRTSIGTAIRARKPVDSILNELRAGAQIELSLDPLPMRFDSLYAEIQGFRSFPGTHAFTDHVQNLQLAGAQPINRIPDCSPAGGHLLDHAVADGFRHIDAAVE